MSGPTNSQLKKEIKNLDNKVERRHKSVMASLSRFKKELMDEIQPMKDYLIGQEAIAKERAVKSVNIPDKVWEVIKLLVIIIATLAGVNQIK